MKNLKSAMLAMVAVILSLNVTGCDDWSTGGGADDFTNDEAFSSANFTGTYSNASGNSILSCIDVFVLQVEHIRNRVVVRTDRGDTLEGTVGPIGGSDGDFDGTSGDAISSFNVRGVVGDRGLEVVLTGTFTGVVAGQTVSGRTMAGTANRSDGVTCAFAGQAL